MVSFEDGGETYEEKKIISHNAGSIEGAVSDALVKELFETPPFKELALEAGITAFPGSSFRHIAVQKAPDNKGVRLIPPHDHLGEPLGIHLPAGCDNAAVLCRLMKIAHEILDRHPINEKRREEGKLPANGIWFWAEGTAAELPGFRGRYGKTGAVVSAVPLCQGIGRLIGLDIIHVDGATGELHTNYEGKADAALEALKTREFVAVHIEAPDECTHDGDTKGKIQAIEWIDSRVIAPLIGRLGTMREDFRMLVISDHRTLTATRSHDASDVPYLIYDSRMNNKTGMTYCEADAARGRFVGDGTRLIDLLFCV